MKSLWDLQVESLVHSDMGGSGLEVRIEELKAEKRSCMEHAERGADGYEDDSSHQRLANGVVKSMGSV